MKILWEFTDDDEDMTLEDLVGDIFITSGKEIILERNTYIDSWLEALIAGLEGVRNSGRFSVEVIEEPDSLIFERQGASVRLLYADLSILVESFDEFAQALQSAVKFFLSQLDKMEKFNKEDLRSLAERLKVHF